LCQIAVVNTSYVVYLKGLSRRVSARLLLASTSEVYGGKPQSIFTCESSYCFGAS